MFFKKGIKLQIIISLLILFIVVGIVSVNWFISMHTHKKTLTENYLNTNYSYAKKLTSSTENQLNYMQKNISAMGEIAGNNHFSQQELDTWYEANNDQFNSIFLTDEKGIVQLISPMHIQNKEGSVVEKGTQLKTETFKNALTSQKPMISAPYYGTTGLLITLISAPIFDKETGDFSGVIGGTIYMESENVLTDILASQAYDLPSYVYVVDHTGKLIYHPEIERIGEDVSANEVVQLVMNNESGSQTITNTKGMEFFSGYSPIKNTGWGIVVQTPTSVVDESLTNLIWKMAALSIPALLIILLIGGVLVSTITKPLNILAGFSEKTKLQDAYQEVEVLNIHSPVYEVRQLYYQVIDYIRVLNKQAKVDGLTEIANRRTLENVSKLWMEEAIPFSLIMIDVDHFKNVNDTYGHLVGDEVLKYLAKEMVKVCTKEDLCFRYGGEEFGILLKNTDEDIAFELAEELRSFIGDSLSPTGKPITISVGVTAYQQADQHVKEILHRADMALYQAKKEGRNRVTVFQVENSPSL